MPCEQLVSFVCDIKQAYTQYGGKRPFGVSILYMGWDKELGYQLYQSDPSGIVHTRLNTVLPAYKAHGFEAIPDIRPPDIRPYRI